MFLKIALLSMWFLAFVGCYFMNKVCPDCKWYPAYALGLSFLVTVLLWPNVAA